MLRRLMILVLLMMGPLTYDGRTVPCRADQPPAKQGRRLQVVENTIDQQNGETRWAVVIGISNYKDSHINLEFPSNDAREMRDTLVQHCGFPADHVQLLIDSQATAANIRSKLGTWLPRVASPNDMVLIYFSGHGSNELAEGVAEEGRRTYLITHEADPKDLYSTTLPMEELYTALMRIRSERTVVLLDCCYSGAATPHAGAAALPRTVFGNGKSGKINGDFLNRLASAGRGRLVMTASDPNEVAYEYPELKHGLFTYQVMEGLKGKALSADGAVTANSLYEYVSNALAAPKAPFQPQRVTGTINQAGVPFILAGKGVHAGPENGKGTLNLLTSPLGAEAIIDKGQPVKTPFKGELTRGSHHVILFKKGYQAVDTEVVITSGHTTSEAFTLEVEDTRGDLVVRALAGAQVKVDDKPVGMIPESGYLRLGGMEAKPHAVHVEAQGFSPVDVVAIVPEGAPRVVEITLTKEIAGKRGAGAGDLVGGLQQNGEHYVWTKDRAEMVFVSEGPFLMGSDTIDDARPKHEQNLPAFWIDRCEVTNRQFADFVSASGYTVKGEWKPVPADRQNRPVVQVTLEDARAYAAWAGKIIPSEAQWEKACRGTDARLYPYIGEFNARLQNMRAYGFNDTLDVGSLPPESASPYGVMDMLGNVWEWCDSAYVKYPGNDASVPNVNRGAYVIRGGSYLSLRDNTNAAVRLFLRPNMSQKDVGFRCAAPVK